MSERTDQSYLLSDQYKDASNLNARAYLHERFSTNKYGWIRWLFDHYRLPAQSRILELGCGPATLWVENMERIPDGWQVTLSDFSVGMLQEAQENLSGSSRRFDFVGIDAQLIPFKDEMFDAVIANYMLFHVPNLPKALSAIQRVLKAGGYLYAATAGPNHLWELRELVNRFDPKADKVGLTTEFNLENGLDYLTSWFVDIELDRYEDALRVTKSQPLLAYVLSSRRSERVKKRREEFIKLVGQEIRLNGDVHITKDTGMFKARKRERG